MLFDYENIIKNLSDNQMIISEGTTYAQVPEVYQNYTISQIKNFLEDEEIRFVNFGYSSGGARSHNLYRSNDKEIFLVFKTANMEDRIYYLSQHILNDIYNQYIS